MSGLTQTKDLVVLVADSDAQQAVRSLLKRQESLEIRPLGADILKHPQRDSGCRTDAHNFLRGYTQSHRYALVLFDHHGCGRDDSPAVRTEAEVEALLASAGWADRCGAVVIEPELEVWVWSDSPNVDGELGWTGRVPGLRRWLQNEGFLESGVMKPTDPKVAMRKALETAGKPLSQDIFAGLAQKVSLERCQDRAFRKFRGLLQKWFPCPIGR